jgi:hypothetical protein
MFSRSSFVSFLISLLTYTDWAVSTALVVAMVLKDVPEKKARGRDERPGGA